MREPELRQLLVELLEASQHPEITAIINNDHKDDDGVAPSISVKFDDGSATYLMVQPEGGWPKQQTSAQKRGY